MKSNKLLQTINLKINKPLEQSMNQHGEYSASMFLKASSVLSAHGLSVP